MFSHRYLIASSLKEDVGRVWQLEKRVMRVSVSRKLPKDKNKHNK